MDLSQSDIIGIMIAARSDEATTERLAQIHEALKEHDETKVTVAALVDEANQARADASRIKAEAVAVAQNQAAKQAELDAREKTLSDHNQALNAEKEAWEAVRERVDREQGTAAAIIAKRNMDLANRENAVTEREAQAQSREDAVAVLLEETKAKIWGMLWTAMVPFEPPPPPPKDDVSEEGADEDAGSTDNSPKPVEENAS